MCQTFAYRFGVLWLGVETEACQNSLVLLWHFTQIAYSISFLYVKTEKLKSRVQSFILSRYLCCIVFLLYCMIVVGAPPAEGQPPADGAPADGAAPAAEGAPVEPVPEVQAPTPEPVEPPPPPEPEHTEEGTQIPTLLN